MLGLLLVDHGSRQAAANAQLAALAALVARERPQDLVGVAHLEISEPSIAEGVASLARRGATEIQVLSCFLVDGRHSLEDVPRLCAEAALAAGIPVRISPALGAHQLLARLLLARAGLGGP